MPGFGDPSTSVTPNRHTYLVLDAPRRTTVQPFYAHDLDGPRIHTSRPGKSEAVEYLPRIGWRLRPYQHSLSFVQEASIAQGAIIDASKATLAPTIAEFNVFRQKPLLDVVYSAGVQSEGSPFLQKRVPAGTSFDQRLEADEASFPGPDTPSNHAPLDRVFVSIGNHSPDEGILVRFFVPGSVHDVSHRLINIYFAGPAGTDDELAGSGRYCLSYWGDGRAELFETGTDDVDAGTDWVKRDEFMWTIPQLVPGAEHHVLIRSNSTQDSAGKYTGSRIAIRSNGHNANLQGSSLVDMLISTAVNAIQLSPTDHVYEVPRRDDAPTTLTPVRIDVRRDIRLQFQVSKTSYPTTGHLDSDVFALPFFPTAVNPIYVQLWGDMPPGTSLAIELHDIWTGEVTALSTLSGPGWEEATFTPVQYSPGNPLGPSAQNYFVRVVFAGDEDHTPTLRRVRVFRNPVFEDNAFVESELGAVVEGRLPTFAIQSVKIQSQGQDPSTDTATIQIEDLGNLVSPLRFRAGMPVRVETEIDDIGTRSVLFSGYVSSATSTKRIGDRGQDWPSKDWHGVVIEANGEWQRVRELFPAKRFYWMDGNSPAGNGAMKVTDVLHLGLTVISGYDADEVDVPDLPLVLLGATEDELVLAVGADFLDYAVDLANAYYGGRLVFDENAGAKGMWRLLLQKRAPYNNLARFYRDHPGNGRLPHMEGAYGTESVVSPLGNDQDVVRAMMQGGTLRVRVEPPECNQVTVRCARDTMSQVAAKFDRPQEGAMVEQTVGNRFSHNFEGLPPEHAEYPTADHPDFLGRVVPIIVQDFSIVGEAAANWYARRILEYAGVARKITQFQGPLVMVVDADDPLQVRPRPLRHYDPVWLQEEDGLFYQYIVSDVNIEYEQDRFQYATYTCVTTSTINKHAIT